MKLCCEANIRQRIAYGEKQSRRCMMPRVDDSQSANEVDDDQVQDDAGEEKIGESALRTDVVEIRFVLRIALNS